MNVPERDWQWVIENSLMLAGFLAVTMEMFEESKMSRLDGNWTAGYGLLGQMMRRPYKAGACFAI